MPKHFYESLSSRLLTNGFLARFLVLECGARGEGRDEAVRPLPEPIREAARWWADFRPGGNLSEEYPEPRLVPATKDATASLHAFRRRVDDTEYMACQANQDEAGMAVWARCYEKARRLALIYACSVNREEPVITLPAAEWASTPRPAPDAADALYGSALRG
ncbi:MAG: hypothetical protein KatS3mg082_1941 [Nitrospiraceae bacterium]|nr:MAG: hypothetical protein KatS3mg082_1941 [Nitrospiraceae bacterium]